MSRGWREALSFCVLAALVAGCGDGSKSNINWWATAQGTFDEGSIVRELDSKLPFGDFGACGRIGHSWTLHFEDSTAKEIEVGVTIASPTKDRTLDVRPNAENANYGDLVDPETDELLGAIWFSELIETDEGRDWIEWNIVGGTVHVISADGGPPLDTEVEVTVEVAATAGMSLPSGTFDLALVMGGTEDFGDRAAWYEHCHLGPPPSP